MAQILKSNKKIPRLTTEEMIEVDRLMIEKYHIKLIQMMENAGRCLAILAVERFLKKKLRKKRVVILAGPGGNGGGALVCGRRLHGWGAQVAVFLAAPEEKMPPVPLHQLDILQQMGLNVKDANALSPELTADLIVDGVIGYSLQGDPRGHFKSMIEWANAHSAPKLALDTPSGLDLTKGVVHQPCIQADATLTLALPKVGLFAPEVLPYRGKLYLGDISVPAELYAEPSLNRKVPKSLFAKSEVLRID